MKADQAMHIFEDMNQVLTNFVLGGTSSDPVRFGDDAEVDVSFYGRGDDAGVKVTISRDGEDTAKVIDIQMRDGNPSVIVSSSEHGPADAVLSVEDGHTDVSGPGFGAPTLRFQPGGLTPEEISHS